MTCYRGKTTYEQKQNSCPHKGDKVLVSLLVLACFLSNLSQLPAVVSVGMTQKLNMPIWIVLLVYLLISGRVTVRYSSAKIMMLMTIIWCGMAILYFLTGINYYNSSVFGCLMLSMLMYLLGELSGKSLKEKDIEKITIAYVLSTTIVCLSIYQKFFSMGIDLTSRTYAYASKNSISQIIFTSIVILMFTEFKEKKLVNIIKVFVIAFQFFLMMLLRSRATIVGFIICILYIVVKGTFSPKLKRTLSVILIGMGIVLLTNDKFNNIIINNILLANRDAKSLDSLTSGRISILQSFPTLIQGHWLTGIGPLFFECFPLSVILQFGCIIGALILFVSYFPLLKSFQFKDYGKYGVIFVIICIGYTINSFFEGLAPIGPGVKCYFMWLLFGILSSKVAGGKQG